MSFNVSKEFREKVYSGESINKAILKIGTNVISNNNISYIKINSPIINNEMKFFKLGNFIGQLVTIKLKNIDGIKLEGKVELKIASKINNTFEEVPIGIYNIANSPEDFYKTATLTLIDNSILFKANVDISKSFTNGSVTAENLLKWLCNHFNVNLGTYPQTNRNVTTGSYDNTRSGKYYISHIAEIMGGFPKINRAGGLDIIPLKREPVVSLNALRLKTWVLKEQYRISRVAFFNAITKNEAGDKTYNTLNISSDNVFMNGTDENRQNIINNIYNSVKDFTIYSLKTENYGDVSLDCWDLIEYDLKGKKYLTLNNNEVIYQQNIMSKIEVNIPNKNVEESTNIIENPDTINQKIIRTDLDQVTGEVSILNKQINEIEGTQEVTQSINGVKEAKFEADGGKLEQARFSGEAEQKTREGYNLLNVPENYEIKGKATFVLNIPEKEGMQHTLLINNLTSDDSNLKVVLIQINNMRGGWQSLEFTKDEKEKVINTKYGIKTLFVYSNEDGATSNKTTTIFSKLCFYEGINKPYEQYGSSPSPNYPSPIDVVDKINYSVAGKNLLNEIKNGYWISDPDIFTENSIYYSAYANLKKGTYTISVKNKPQDENVVNKFIREYVDNIVYNIQLVADKHTFTLQKDGLYSCVMVGKDIDFTVQPDIQIEKGEQATEYVPYQNFAQEILLPNGEFLAKIGDVSDELKEDGTIVKRIGKYIPVVNDIKVQKYTKIQYAKIPKLNDDKNYGKYATNKILCNESLFTTNLHGDWGSELNINYIYSQADLSNYWLGLPIDLTLEQIKEKLNGIIIYYQLKEERTAKLTADELTKLQNLQVLKGENNLTSNAYTYGNYTLTVPALYTLQEKLTQIDLNQDNISLLAKKTTTVEKQAEDNSKVINETKTQLGEIRVNQENIQLEVRDITDNGVSKVKNTLVNIDQEGMRVSKSGEEINTLISNTGMYVNDHDTNLLTADKNGVVTENLLVRTYANIGYHRFEKFIENGEKRTGCFYIG